eukprot:UN34891
MNSTEVCNQTISSLEFSFLNDYEKQYSLNDTFDKICKYSLSTLCDYYCLPKDEEDYVTTDSSDEEILGPEILFPILFIPLILVLLTYLWSKPDTSKYMVNDIQSKNGTFVPYFVVFRLLKFFPTNTNSRANHRYYHRLFILGRN